MPVMETPKRFTLSFPSMQVAESLLKIGAVKLNVNSPFTWTSGIQSPIYCDIRMVNSKVEVRDELAGDLVELIRNTFPDVEIIAGVSTGGIPMGALIADRMKLPFIYVRGEAKKYGLMKQVEGYYKEGSKVVVFEDHVSTGGSSLNAIKALRAAGLEALGLVSIMTYAFKTTIELYKQENIKYQSLCDLETVIETAVSKEMISEKDKEHILKFRDDHEEWVKNHFQS